MSSTFAPRLLQESVWGLLLPILQDTMPNGLLGDNKAKESGSCSTVQSRSNESQAASKSNHRHGGGDKVVSGRRAMKAK